MSITENVQLLQAYEKRDKHRDSLPIQRFEILECVQVSGIVEEKNIKKIKKICTMVENNGVLMLQNKEASLLLMITKAWHGEQVY